MTITRKFAGAVSALALSVVALAAPASAEENKLDYSITIAGTSDYIFRGISFNKEDPAFQPYLELTYNIFYVGFWGSNFDPGAPSADSFAGPWEVDVYFGARPVTGPISWDLGILYYMYGTKGADDFGDLNYVEFKVAGTYSPIENLSLGATVYYQPDQGYAATESASFEGSINYTLPKLAMLEPTIGGMVGHTTSGKNSDYPDGGYWAGASDYTYWNFGVKFAVENFYMDFRYWDTDIEENALNSFDNDVADERFVFTAGVTLP